ncbi:MAG TPA: GntR family transcriptional regulator [Sphingobacteriaceae bacterium]|nr:GntR family transcriptional regulator [Sphingobacteriaceae bacterium]
MIEHSELSQPVYLKLKDMILSRELMPGQKIIQEKIAKQLGVSRTPLLKALQMLEYEMLVESVPRRGMFVKLMDLREMIEIFDCRESLEGMAVNLLTERKNPAFIQKLQKVFDPFLSGDIDIHKYRKADARFHQLIVDLCGNATLKRLYFFGNIYSKVVQAGLVRTPEETLPEHLKILEAIKVGNGKLAEQELRQHINNSKKLLMAYSIERDN